MNFSFEFQRNILKFLLTSKEGIRYFSILSDAIFDDPLTQIVYTLLKTYYGKYKELPSNINFNEYTKQVLIKKNTPPDQILEIQQELNRLFHDIPEDIEIIKENIIIFSQYQEMKKTFATYGQKILGAKQIDYQTICEVRDSISNIIDIQKKAEGDIFSDFFVLADYEKRHFVHQKSYPTFLKCLNSTLATGGISSPAVCVLLGAAKGCKTTFLINSVLHYARIGLKVVYFDIENGYDRIHQMIYQSIVNCTMKELLHNKVRKSNIDYTNQSVIDHIKELKEIMKVGSSAEKERAEALLYERYYDKYNDRIIEELNLFDPLGSIKVEYNPRMSMSDIYNSLHRLKHNNGFVPDVIVIDYIDKMVDHKSRTPAYYQIQDLYSECKALVTDIQAHAWTPSQVDRSGQDADRIRAKHVAGDIGKFYNADLLCSIVRTEEEEQAGYGRFEINASRIGSKFIQNFPKGYPLRIDTFRCRITELTEQELTTYSS